ncbi:MAG TPA: cytochrome c/FTR1 family iron permease [Ramlibacter sp.]|uniref:cytochrome c/FTR1 family iron permease n=1 Tax=Ramlibacter sp. TaxID=1917967 RepID=UPI002ED3C7D8
MRAQPAFARFFLRACVAIALALSGFAAGAATSEEQAQTVIHMLDYVSVDYPGFVKDGKVLDESEYQEQREFAGQSVKLLEQLPAAEGKEAVLAKARQLLARVDAKEDGAEVSSLARAVVADVVRVYKLAVAPRQAPDLQRAAQLFAANCAACHGAAGRGDGPLAKGMDPSPSNFHDDARMKQRSIYGLYNTITLGVGGTPMRAFSEFNEGDRWALAFLAAGMRAPADTVARGETLWTQGGGREALGNLRALVTSAPQAVQQQGGADLDAVRAFLTARPEALAAVRADPLSIARARLQDSIAAYRKGDRQAARQAAITAYLEGFELVEAGLDNVDADLRKETEREMMALRTAIDSAVPVQAMEAQVGRIDALLDRAAERLSGDAMSAEAAFVSSLLILLREGLEAILVLAAIIAFVRKTGRRDALPYIHAGWGGAILLGVATWFVAGRLLNFSGAGREMTEGITALVAAAMLLYVGYWLHGKSNAQAWATFIREHVSAALEKRTLWAMAGISFLAVYRELFEIILFYQTLWVQAGAERQGAVLAGMGTAVALLAITGWAILRFSVRLPLGPFFTATSALLVVMAVVFVGHGVAALQEAGVLHATPVHFVNLPLLGIHATVQGLGSQAAMLAAIALMLWLGRRTPAAART